MSSSRPGAFAARLARPDLGPVVVAEVAQSHDGSLGQAHAFVDAVAAAGAEAIKFQIHIASAESTPGEPWRVPFSRQDASRYEYWQRMEFSEDQWRGLREHADEAGIAFISSPFSREAVDLLDRVGVAAWKVASGEVGNLDLIRAVGEREGPVVLSSGLSPWAEIEHAVTTLRAMGKEPVVLQCTTAYPTAPEDVGLNVLDELRNRLGVETGLSDHSATIYPGLAAAALGACMVEVHVTLSPWMFGPDVIASLDVDALTELATGCRHIGRMLGAPIDKDLEASTRGELRSMFGRSLVAARDLPAGTVLAADHLIAKKPGGGVPASDRDSLVGLRLLRALVRDQPIDPKDVTR